MFADSILIKFLAVCRKHFIEWNVVLLIIIFYTLWQRILKNKTDKKEMCLVYNISFHVGINTEKY